MINYSPDISREKYFHLNKKSNVYSECKTRCRLRVVPQFSSGIVERAKHEGASKSPHVRKRFTCARVSLSLLCLRKNGGLLVV